MDMAVGETQETRVHHPFISSYLLFFESLNLRYVFTRFPPPLSVIMEQFPYKYKISPKKMVHILTGNKKIDLEIRETICVKLKLCEI